MSLTEIYFQALMEELIKFFPYLLTKKESVLHMWVLVFAILEALLYIANEFTITMIWLRICTILVHIGISLTGNKCKKFALKIFTATGLHAIYNIAVTQNVFIIFFIFLAIWVMELFNNVLINEKNVL